jgi:radical SAM protein with 4Fe4S-binding SPASM domain
LRSLKTIPFPRFQLWQQPERLERKLLTVNLELTARCNNNCRHCYINQPENDAAAMQLELSTREILDLADEAVERGCLWWLITGGEPLLREDFADIYVGLKRRGLLVSVFTNATLIADEHVALFRHYPPRNLEVTVYGVTDDGYERVTRQPGSFRQFRAGLQRLFDGGLKVNLKSVAMKSNLNALADIEQFCRRYSHGPFRMDMQLHLRHDREPRRNARIRAERLEPEAIAALSRCSSRQAVDVAQNCHPRPGTEDGGMFYCGAGLNECTIGCDGRFRLCSSLVDPQATADLRQRSLTDLWVNLVPAVRKLPLDDPTVASTCYRCDLIDLCQQCPALAYLETGRYGGPVERFCREAHARMGRGAVKSSDE